MGAASVYIYDMDTTTKGAGMAYAPTKGTLATVKVTGEEVRIWEVREATSADEETLYITTDERIFWLADLETHDCDENAVPYTSDGALGHGWECGLCGKFLQAG